MVETITYTYTTADEIKRIFSTAAVELRVDDDEDGYVNTTEDDVYTDIVYDATDVINLYLEQWYDPSDMAENSWIRRQATWIGCYLLSQRRGNPSQYNKRYEEVIAQLEKIQEGKLQVPRLPHRADFTPALSNYRIDDRNQVQKIRVQPNISTGGTSARQHTDRDVYNDYP